MKRYCVCYQSGGHSAWYSNKEYVEKLAKRLGGYILEEEF